jgi:hypothetical protein
MAITSIKTGSSFTNLVKYNDFLAGNPAFNPSSYESIASLTGNGSATSLTFSSIPSTYTHLQIRAIGRDSSGYIRFNSDTGANYSRHQLRGNGAAASAAGAASQNEMFGFDFTETGNLADTYGVGIVDIHDYASTSKYKTIRSFTGKDLNGSGNVYLYSGLWMSTSAISSITIYSPSAAPTTASTFALYGIKGA